MHLYLNRNGNTEGPYPAEQVKIMVGWWGIPWGIFYTIGALWKNASGGIEVTGPVIATWIGPERAGALLHQRPKPPVGGLWLLRGIIATPLLLLVLMIFGIFSSVGSSSADRAGIAGYSEYRKANQHITNTTTTSGKGNSELATQAAQSAASIMHGWFEFATTIDPNASRKGVAVWCEAGPDRALFLIKVPDLRSFNNDAKDEIAHTAWTAAQIAARDLDLQPGAELAVAVRGVALYDRMLVGRFVPNLTDDDVDTAVALEESILKTERRLNSGEKMATCFAPPED